MKRISLILLFLFLPLVFSRAGILTYEKNDARSVSFRCESGDILRLSLCSPSVVKVEYGFGGSLSEAPPTPAVIRENLEPVEWSVSEDGRSYEIFTGQLRLSIDKDPLCLRVYDHYQKLLVADIPDSYKKDGQRIFTAKTLARDEAIFGLGEKGGLMNRRGGVFTMWNSDKPCYCIDEDPLYKSIPFFLSSKGYGIFFDNSWRTTFDFTARDRYTMEADGGEMVYYIMSGEDYKSVLRQYINLTGSPVMPPKWALGFSQCRGLYTRQDLALEVARKFREWQIPCDVIYQDIGWTRYLQDFVWNPRNYPSPKEMLDTLHSMGYHVVVSQDPVISQRNQAQWAEADSLGLFARDDRTGKTYDMPWPWGGRCGVVDFTNPAAAPWWGALQQRVIDDGVDGFWTDMGEPAWSNEEETDRLHMQHNAGPHGAIHNVYGLYWDRVVTEEFERFNPDRRLFQMTRSAFSGMQRYCFSWTGDSGSERKMTDSWEQFSYQIPMMLSAGLGGIPFITGDITGYCGTIDDYEKAAELYIRWMQFGLFTPLSRAHHEGDTAVEPWMFGDEAVYCARKAIELKYTLLPYIYTCAREAYDTGLPLMRAMFLEFPKDRECRNTDMQFMFGPDLLVVPVYEEGARVVEAWLPKGRWYDWYDGTEYEGGRYVKLPAPLERIPVLVKAGAIIPTAPVRQYTGEDPDADWTLRIWPVEGKESRYELYEDDGLSLGYKRGEYARTLISCTLENGVCRISIEEPSCQGGYVAPTHPGLKITLPSTGIKTVVVNGRKVRKHKEGNSLTVSL